MPEIRRTQTARSRRKACLRWSVRLDPTLWLVLALLACRCPSALGQDWVATKAAGTQEALWVLFETMGEDGLETRVWMRQVNRGFRRPRDGGYQPPGIRVVAASGKHLHLFTKRGSHYRVGPQRSSPQRILLDRQIPLCLAGDTPQETVYAVARQIEPDASPPTTTRAAATAPTTSVAAESLTTPSATSAPSDIWAIHAYRQSRWEVLTPMYKGFDPSDQHWICAHDGTIHLFRLGRGPRAPVQHYQWSEGSWSPEETVPLPPNANPLAAMWINTYLVLVVWRPPGEGESSLIAIRRVGDEFKTVALEAEGGEPLDLSPDDIRVAEFNGRVAVVGRFEEGGSLSVGLWKTEGGPPEEPPEALPEGISPEDVPAAPRLPQILQFVVLAGVVMLVLWRRHDSLVQEIPLPEPIALASIWRRLVAFLLDIAPAIAVTSFYWLPIYYRIQEEIAVQELTDVEQAQRYAALLWPWLVIRVIYIVYCGLTEFRWGATPGKRLLQCWVISTDLTRPAPKQIAIRNGVKLLELEHEVFALLVFIVLTRNQQRLGDLLAQTIVVEPAPASKEEESE